MHVRHNLERAGPPPRWARAAATLINGSLYRSGGYGGDFVSILGSLRELNRADVVFATVDTVGIPLILLARIGLVRAPIVYVAVGLPERLVQLRGARMQRFYADAFTRVHTVVSYAPSEAEWLRTWFGSATPRVAFVPFGVDVDAFRPIGTDTRDDVLSIGADPQRDFNLLVELAKERPSASFRIITTADRARRLGTLPSNVVMETDIPLEEVRDRLATARVVALPVRGNSYSGATTTLLQAMAMAKPVVVSRTDAIATGYELEDGVNCRLVTPGDRASFGAALDVLLSDAEQARALGAAARHTAVTHLSWQRYADRVAGIIAEASPAGPASADSESED